MFPASSVSWPAMDSWVYYLKPGSRVWEIKAFFKSESDAAPNLFVRRKTKYNLPPKKVIEKEKMGRFLSEGSEESRSQKHNVKSQINQAISVPDSSAVLLYNRCKSQFSLLSIGTPSHIVYHCTEWCILSRTNRWGHTSGRSWRSKLRPIGNKNEI